MTRAKGIGRLILPTLAAIAWMVATVGAGWTVPEATAASRGFAGKWLGTLVDEGAQVRFAFEITEAKEGGYTAMLHAVDQAGVGQWTSVTVKGDVLRLEMGSAFAYEGILQPDGDTIVGNWIQERSYPMVMKRVEAIPVRVAPQTPQPPYPYREEEVAYENPAAHILISGALTLPRGRGPFPAVLLIGGSGHTDRNESIGIHRPFLVLADRLTRQGIAVLRVDKRGVGKTTGTWRGSAFEEFASDAQAGVSYLTRRPEVDAAHIGLVGHSEGGMVAPLVATRSRDVAFVVLLGAPGLSPYDLLVLQDGAEAKAAGSTDEQVELIRGFSRRYYDIVRRTQDPAEIERETKALYAALTEEEKAALGVFGWPDLHGSLNLSWALNPAAHTALNYDVTPALRTLRCPVLALIGEKDAQVPPKENLGAIERELRAGGNPDFTVQELPGLNHMLQTCSAGATAEYDKIDETIAPVVLQIISDWIIAHTTKVGAPG
jgi:pimeloyl-ACP methyl ester carboxylesterase